jgi:hypothetical protein
MPPSAQLTTVPVRLGFSPTTINQLANFTDITIEVLP